MRELKSGANSDQTTGFKTRFEASAARRRECKGCQGHQGHHSTEENEDDDGDYTMSLSRSYFLDACYTANLPSDP